MGKAVRYASTSTVPPLATSLPHFAGRRPRFARTACSKYDPTNGSGSNERGDEIAADGVNGKADEKSWDDEPALEEGYAEDSSSSDDEICAWNGTRSCGKLQV